MNYQTKCYHCGHIKVAYVSYLSKQLVRALRKLVDYYDDTKKSCNLQKDIDLTKNQYNNFQKLQYFNLAKRSDIGWFPTIQGIEFIKGKEEAIDMIATIESEVLDFDHEAWKTHNSKPKPVMIWDIDKDSWKQKVEYQAEKSQQINIFS